MTATTPATLDVPELWMRSSILHLDPFVLATSHGVELHREVAYHGNARVQPLCIVYEREFDVYGKCGGKVGVEMRRVAERLTGRFDVDTWPGPLSYRCHTDRRSHPWNAGQEPPGHHFCSACKLPAFVEFHGCADGECSHCGHSG